MPLPKDLASPYLDRRGEGFDYEMAWNDKDRGDVGAPGDPLPAFQAREGSHQAAALASTEVRPASERDLHAARRPVMHISLPGSFEVSDRGAGGGSHAERVQQVFAQLRNQRPPRVHRIGA